MKKVQLLVDSLFYSIIGIYNAQYFKLKIRICGVAICFILMGFYDIQAQNIYTVAGNGNIGYSGDGSPAISAELYSPSAVAFDQAGNYYIADEQNNVVRKVATNGIITTVAGTGVGGFGGDGGLATLAKMNWTISVAFDSIGNMYISDRTNQRIRKVNLSGIISTYAGTGTAGYNGDGIPASTAQINNPDDIVVYANSLYIADFSNNRIRKIDLKTGIITTVAGTVIGGFSGDGGPATSAKLNNPYGVAFDKHGNMFIGDQSNYCVREVMQATGIITTIAGRGGINGSSGDGGLATIALMSSVTGVAVGNTGNVYIADTPNQKIRKVDGQTGIITTIAGTGLPGYSGDGGPAIAAELYYPNGVTLHDTCDDLYFPDWGNERVREIVGADAVFNITGKTPICQNTTDTLVASGGTIYKWSNGATSSSIIVSPASTTTYSVKVSNICSDTRDTNITITVIPFQVTLSGKDSICNGNSTILSATGGGTYKWSNGSTSNTITVKPLADTAYSVLVTNNGCSKDTTMKIKVKPVPAVALSGNNTICIGDTTTLNATGGGTYKWSNGSTSGSITIYPLSNTTYSITVTNNNGCSKDTSIKVTVTPLPSISFVGKTNVCIGDTTTLYVSGGGTYKWNNGSTSNVLNIRPLIDTTYFVMITKNGCSRDTSIKIVVSPAPTITLSGNNLICAGDTVTLNATGGGTYKWSNGSTSSSITTTPLSNTTYSLTVTNGCQKDTAIKVIVTPVPSISLTGKTNICIGDSTTLYSSGGGTYHWNNGSTSSDITISPLSNTTYSVMVSNDGCSKDTNITIHVSKLTVGITSSVSICSGDTVILDASGGGTYKWSNGSSTSSIKTIPASTITYSVIITNGACMKDTEVIVTVKPSPVAIIKGINHLCKGDSVVLTATGGGTYQWSTGQTSSNITVIPSSTSAYTVVVTSANGCQSDTTFQVSVITVSGVISGPGSLCPKDSIELTATGGGSYLWSTGATNSSIVIKPTKDSIYSVIVNNGCLDTITKAVVVDAPVLYACCDTVVTSGTPIILIANGTTKYSWMPSTGLSCDSCPNPIVTPTVATTYTVIGTDSAGCKTERIITVDLSDCYAPFIPNVFTPNGDGVNDEFVVDTKSVSDYSISIYDRWGKELYQSSNPDAYWDGKNQYNNTMVSSGVYYYIIKYTCDNKSHNKDGYIQLIK